MLVHVVVVSAAAAATTTHLLILEECRIEMTLATLEATCQC